MSAQPNITPLHEWGIQCLSLRTLNKGSLVAFCDLGVERWGVIIRDAKWFKKGTNEWIGLPSSQFTTRDGRTEYRNLVEFEDRELKRRFDEEALRALKSWTRG